MQISLQFDEFNSTKVSIQHLLGHPMPVTYRYTYLVCKMPIEMMLPMKPTAPTIEKHTPSV